jgi:hypothetical protein
MEKNITENREHMEKNMDENMKINMEQMEQKMDGNMKRNMEQMENKVYGKLEHMENYILEALNGRIPKIYKVCERNHENKGSVQVEKLSNSKNFLGGGNSNNGFTYGWFPKGVSLPKIELRKFDGTYIFT